MICFDSYGVEYIPKEVQKIIFNNSIVTNIYRKQTYHPLICGYFSVEFVDLMIKGKGLLSYTNFSSPNEYIKNNNIILKYVQ